MRDFLKKSYFRTFLYPEMMQLELNYDDYWRHRRTGVLGVCNSFQLDRANWISSRISKGATLVDVGCGDACVLRQIDKLVKLGKSWGVDNTKYVLDNLQSTPFEPIEYDAFNGSWIDLPNADHYLMLEVIEHAPNSEKILELALSKSSKSVFFSVPNTGYFVYRLRLLFGKFPLQWRSSPSEHLRFWTSADLKWWLNMLGYSGKYTIKHYQGIRFFNRLMPSLFAEGLIVELKK